MKITKCQLISWQSHRDQQDRRCQSPASTGRFSFCWSALGRRKLEQVEMRSSRSRHCCKAPCCCIPCCNWSLADCTSESLAVYTRKMNIGHTKAAHSELLRNSRKTIGFLAARPELASQSRKVPPCRRCQKPANSCTGLSANSKITFRKSWSSILYFIKLHGWNTQTNNEYCFWDKV